LLVDRISIRRRKMRNSFRILAGLVALTLVLAACGGPATTETPTSEPTAPPATEEATAAPTQGEPTAVKIGIVTVLTGDAGFLGVEQRNAAKVTVDLFNEETGSRSSWSRATTCLTPTRAK